MGRDFVSFFFFFFFSFFFSEGKVSLGFLVLVCSYLFSPVGGKVSHMATSANPAVDLFFFWRGTLEQCGGTTKRRVAHFAVEFH